MFATIKHKYILTLLLGLLLVSCSQNTTPLSDSGQEVLGIGTVDIAMPGTEIQPASFESGYVNLPSSSLLHLLLN